MGTTINSTAANNAVHVFRCPGGDVLLSLRVGSAIYVRETDLKAALGVDELGCGCDEADHNLKAAIARAEIAEQANAALRAEMDQANATLAQVEAAVGEIAAEAETARVSAIGLSDAAWSRLTETSYVLSDAAKKIRAALDPKPAFTLPTEAGAVILATGRGNKQHYELHRTTTGRWITPGVREDWDDERVLSAFTDHRLIGADQ